MAELKNIRIAISGIYDYALEELPSLQLPLPQQGAPKWVEKKRVYKVYRPATVLQAACEKFKLLPLTHHHTKQAVDGSNFRELAVGYTGENPFIDYLEDKGEVGVRNTLLIYDDEALNAYDNGEIQLSPGYIAEFEWNKGHTPKGEEYDIVMKRILEVNHLALLPCGRGGSDAVVMDCAAKEKSIFELVKETLDGAPKGNDNASKDHVKEEEEKPKIAFNEPLEELKNNYEKLKELSPISIDKNKNITDKKEAENVFRKIGNIKNTSDGRTANFAVQTVSKILNHKGFEYGKIIESIGEIFRKSQRICSEKERMIPGHKEHPNIKSFNNYVNKISLDGKNYYIRFTAREEYPGKKNPNRKMIDNLHSCAVSDIALYEIRKGNSLISPGADPEEKSSRPFSDDILIEFFRQVKEKETVDCAFYSISFEKRKSIFEIVNGSIFDRFK